MIKVKNLSRKYDFGSANGRLALDDVTFDVPEGSVISIIGRTGSGKSSLISHLNGLLIPQSGSVTVDGTHVSSDKKALKQIRAKVGLVFQYPESQLFAATVREELKFAPENFHIRHDIIANNISSVSEKLQISDLLDRDPLELSGGQKRMVAIASVLTASPKYIVLDEPLAGLDSRSARLVMQYVSEHAKNGGAAVIVTHDITQALVASDKILVLENGRSLSFGTPIVTAAKICGGEIDLAAPEMIKFSWLMYKAGRIKNFAFSANEIANQLIAKEKE